MRRPLSAAVGATIALTLAGLVLAAGQKDAFSLNAVLKARFEVPKPKGVPADATGTFRGKAVEQENDRARVTWKLTFSGLSGRAVAAHIHAGRPGQAGNVIVPLCGPCRNGQQGAATITHAQLKKIRARRAYVNIHTKKNPAGEIRGQIKVSRASSSDQPPITTTPTTPEPPPYP